MVNFIGFDVETRGSQPTYALEPCRTQTGEAWLTSFAWADPTTHHTLKPTQAELRYFLNECIAKKQTICGWNTPFDIAWLIAMGLKDEVYANRWLDGMLLWRHLRAAPLWLDSRGFGLKAAVTEYYPDEAGYEHSIDFNADSEEGLRKLAKYNEDDARHTLNLCKLFWGQLSADQRRAALIEAACLPMVAESMVNGICADAEAAEELRVELENRAKLALVKLKFKTREDIDESTLASPMKLRKLLFEDWGLPPVKWTPKGSESTDRDALSLLAPEDERAWLLNEFREAKNNRTKFAEGALKSLEYNGDGRVRPAPRVFGTYTGRMSYSSKVGKGKEERPSGIALHQWKRDPAFRKIITAPPGYTLIELDFAGQEFRWMAEQSRDATMIKLCAPGEDSHAFMGGRITGRGYADMLRLKKDEDVKLARHMGKVANLSLQYRTSPRTLVRVARVQYALAMTEGQARNIHRTYRQTYPGVERYWKRAINDARINGYAETFAGRQIQLGKGEDWTLDNLWGLESTAINSPIQGSGADQKYLALAVARDYLPSVDGLFYFELHDGLFFIVPDAKAEKALVELRDLLSHLPYKKAWGKQPCVEFPVDAKWGKSWGGLEAYE